MTETPQQDRVNTEHLRDYTELRRSVTDRKVAGVAGGLGRHLNIDPTILRVAFVVLALFGGAGFLLYGALWLFVPEDGKTEAPVATPAATRNAVLLIAAVVAALLVLGDSWGGFPFPWPLAIVALVLVFLVMNRDKPMSTTYPPPPPGGPEPGPPQPGISQVALSGSESGSGSGSGSTAYAAPTEDTEATRSFGTVPPTPAPYPAYQPPAPRPDRGPKLFWFTVALLAVALGTLGLFDVAGNGIPDSAYPALALTVIGVMLVVGAWFGRAGGLVALGVVATVALIGTSVAEPRFEGDRRIDETPTTAVQVEDRYFVPAGAIGLDLSNIRDVERLDGRTIEVEANAGEIVVTLPEGVDVNLDADVSMAGEITVAGDTRGGTGVSVDRTIDGGADAPQIDLQLDLLVGSIEVRQ